MAKAVKFNKTIDNVANVSSNIYDQDVTNNRANMTVVSAGVKLGDLVAASKAIKSYYERYGKLPSSVTIAGQRYTMAQLLYLLTKAAVNINVGNLDPIMPRSVGAPPSPGGSYRHGRLYKSEYLKVANNILAFIGRYNRAPNYASTSLGRIPFTRLVYIYSKIITFWGTNKRLPRYLWI